MSMKLEHLTAQYLTERFLNLIGDDPRKQKYKNDVYELLVRSYKSIGGLKGDGTQSPDDLLSIPFWKLVRKNGKIIAVILYKDKNGRKSVALGTDGSSTAIRALKDIMNKEPERSYSEKSKSSLNFFLKSNPNAKDFLIPRDKVESIIGKKIFPYSDGVMDKLDVSEKEQESVRLTLHKYPFLGDYGYFREIGGELMFKVLVGTPNLSIT